MLLLDEPTSGLDPISTGKVEEALQELKRRYTIVIVPHSVQQAARVADYAAFFLMGELVECQPGRDLFTTRATAAPRITSPVGLDKEALPTPSRKGFCGGLWPPQNQRSLWLTNRNGGYIIGTSQMVRINGQMGEAIR